MRTTLTVSEAIYSEFKILAAQSHEPVSSVIETAMREYLLLRKSHQLSEVPDLPTFDGGELFPGVNLDDMSSVYELLDQGQPVDAIR